jgi:hypothetical protein
MSKHVFLKLVLAAGMFFLPVTEVLPQTAVKNEQVADWVKNRVKTLQPTPDEKRFDEVGWAGSIVEAERLAREHNRPVFLFAHDGRIESGRC